AAARPSRATTRSIRAAPLVACLGIGPSPKVPERLYTRAGARASRGPGACRTDRVGAGRCSIRSGFSPVLFRAQNGRSLPGRAGGKAAHLGRPSREVPGDVPGDSEGSGAPVARKTDRVRARKRDLSTKGSAGPVPIRP